MPRVAKSTRTQHVSAATPLKQAQQSPYKIPLNDDRQEKAVRLQSRQALHELQLNSLKAAASPVRKLNNYARAASDSPKTPRSHGARGDDRVEDGAINVVASTAMTPMKRVPILANFEEWMKMATDNKINAANSWNFALIDYFHDMSLLKEGDGVNFQKASCTLDGCVKIYTSRVDSVATETGKLLSGLADSGNRKSKRDDEEGEDNEAGDEDAEIEDGSKKKPKKKAQRSSEATLAPSFAALQLKKFELEFSVDPLFKKASADFDEGGAKGLLLNHLAIDANGRIVFDSSDDAGDAEDTSAEADIIRQKSSDTMMDLDEKEPCQKNAGTGLQGIDIDIDHLRASFFPDLAKLDEQDICPSLKNFELGNPAGTLDIPFLKAPEDRPQDTNSPIKGNLGDQTGVFLDGDNVAGFEDDDDVIGGFDLGADAGFGEGGEVWAQNAVIEPQIPIGDVGFAEGAVGQGEGEENFGVGGFHPDSQQYAVSMQHKQVPESHDDILSYFDNALQKNWAGPEHWRIKRLKDISKPPATASSRRKEKEPFEIDFTAPLDQTLAEMLYTPATSNASISLPKSQWKSKSRNLLPDDKHFNSKQLLRLFLKPKARMGSRRKGFGGLKQLAKHEQIPEGEMDEAFWARKDNILDQASSEEQAPQGDYDANFFQDDGLGFPDGPPDDDEVFADAKEALSPGIDGQDRGQHIDGTMAAGGSQEGAFGTQIVTQNRRVRPEYVQYARVAKKVDVRRLKEEMWRGIGFEENIAPQAPAIAEPPPKSDDPPLKFTSVMNNLQQVYPQQTMADISTSYCFICLLHLANEKGLTLGNEPGLDELIIKRDYSAEITEENA